MNYRTEIQAINSFTDITIQLDDYVDYIKVGDNIRFNYHFKEDNKTGVTTLVEAIVVNIDHLLQHYNEVELVKFITIKISDTTLVRLSNLLKNKKKNND